MNSASAITTVRVELGQEWHFQGTGGRVTMEADIKTATKLMRSLEDVLCVANRTEPEVERIIRIVAARHGKKPDWLLSDTRCMSVVWARRIAMFVSRLRVNASMNELGRSFAYPNGKRRDGDTVRHNVMKVRERTDVDPVFGALVQSVLEQAEKEAKESACLKTGSAQ